MLSFVECKCFTRKRQGANVDFVESLFGKGGLHST